MSQVDAAAAVLRLTVAAVESGSPGALTVLGRMRRLTLTSKRAPRWRGQGWEPALPHVLVASP